MGPTRRMALEFTWAQTDGLVIGEGHLQRGGSELRILPNAMGPWRTYSFQLIASPLNCNDPTNKGRATVVIKAGLPPLFAKIVGGDRMVPQSQRLHIDGNHSHGAAMNTAGRRRRSNRYEWRRSRKCLR